MKIPFIRLKPRSASCFLVVRPEPELRQRMERAARHRRITIEEIVVEATRVYLDKHPR